MRPDFFEVAEYAAKKEFEFEISGLLVEMPRILYDFQFSPQFFCKLLAFSNGT